MWTGEEATKKGIPILKRAGFESVEDLPRTAVGYSSNAYQDLPPQLRLSATSNGEQRVRVTTRLKKNTRTPPHHPMSYAGVPKLGLCNYVELIDPTFRDAGGVD